MTIRPRRSVLYMPGSNLRALEKAKTLPADSIIVDLEDAVGPETKVAARAKVAEMVKAGAFGSREVIVRINGIDTDWGDEDLSMIAKAGPNGVLLPKVSNIEQLEMAADRLLELRASALVRIWAMLETPLAVLFAGEIAAAAENKELRFEGVVMGTNDLAKETGARIVPGRATMMPWMMTCIAAARAYRLVILDGVYNDLSDIDGFAAECRQARDMGFDGKTLIHPNQIGPCNDAFSPGEEEIAQARKIIAAFELPENRGKGVVSLDGRMVERMHADMARKTVAIAEAIAQSGC